MALFNIPDGWKLKPLAMIADIVSGGTPSRENSINWIGGSISWVTPTDITSNGSRILTETSEKITKIGLKNCSAHLLPIGSILMTSRATVGESKIAGVEVCTNQGFKSLVPKSGIDNWYLYYQMQYNKNRYSAFGIGTTFLEVNKKDTERFIVPCAPVNEQVQIGKILTTVDNIIEKTEALIAKYNAIKQGMMQDLFTRGVDENGKLRPSFEEAPELYKNSKMGWIPKEWDVQFVGNIFEIQLGKMLSQASKKDKNPYPYLANRNIQWGHIDISDLETMDFNDSERKKFSLEYGDLLVCEGGEVGRTAIWLNEMENCYYQKAIHRLRPKDKNVKPLFMLYFIRHASAMGWFNDFTSQTSIAHLTMEKLSKVPMILPMIFEQDAIISRLDSIDKISLKEKDCLSKLIKIKSGLMQDLLTGKKRVKVDEDIEERPPDVRISAC